MDKHREPVILTSRRDFLLVTGSGIIATSAAAAFGQLTTPDKTTKSPNEKANVASDPSKSRSVAIVWKDDIEGGEITVTYAALNSVNGHAANDPKSPGDFTLKPGVKRLEIFVDDAQTGIGALATRVTVRFHKIDVKSDAERHGFTFFLRDVATDRPIIVRGLQVAVVPQAETRNFEQLDASVKAKKWQSDRDLINAAPEETYENACRNTKSMPSPTWLGVGRDMRMFHAMYSQSTGLWGTIEALDYSGEGNTRILPVQAHSFLLGRGSNCDSKITRRLDDGVLPILKSVQYDGDIEYRLTIFASLENEPLRPDNVRGTHWIAAYRNTLGSKLTDKETAQYKELYKSEVTNREQEIVCWVHVEIVNTGNVPRYAYFWTTNTGGKIFATDKKGNNVVSIARLNGQPVPQKEMSVLVEPKKPMTLELIYPHRPISTSRAESLSKQDFGAHYQACRAFWQHKLDQGSQVSLPEAAIQERVRAGLLHLDIVTTGMSKEGPLLANVGIYPPIGSESAPIMQAYDSFGYHELAERTIQLFLNRQREDGFIMTYENYQLETGPVLWTIGEHFRYTHDVEWARRIQPNVMKACKYILAWRRRNMKEELRGKGYGLLEGRVADPFDYYHAYMLNALTYVGLKRVVEVYDEIDPAAIAEVKNELGPYLVDIRESYADNVARSPVIPLGDGMWVPSFSPWAEYAGPVSLHADGGSWFSHHVFACRDTLIGSLYMGIGEVLEPNGQLADWMLHAHQELMTLRNAGMSQPYYCRHDWLHLKRGEVKEFLKTYYNQLTAMQDRETYTFWEHTFGGSQHKTHEEAWFLMQTRWMLWHEDYESRKLNLLSMIPRNWLEAGKEIKLENCKSYFGSFSLFVKASNPLGTGEATIELHGPAKNYPKSIAIRIPHPTGKQPTGVVGGTFDASTESISVKTIEKSTRITVRYA